MRVRGGQCGEERTGASCRRSGLGPWGVVWPGWCPVCTLALLRACDVAAAALVDDEADARADWALDWLVASFC